ncbi:hypothetical protein O6H91_01G145100 [Diphasiastrum complanatum]|uniref:Uncharacterized protein n=1 Tax=Diphasiastrum complanatum TaxID=34168 RepID=A0ACC2EX46_DIPCM|nr:hypothetical protein O6H91_01G145100 [Diphasiastrum complanatum]
MATLAFPSLSTSFVAPSSSSSSSSASVAATAQLPHCIRLRSLAEVSGKRHRGGRRKMLLAAKNDQQGAGDSESKQVLDAFFLGKAFADTVNERLGSAIGEFLSEVGRKQAEQQKEVRKFQEEVQERARIAKLKASRQALSKEDEETTKKSPSHEVSSTQSRNGGEVLPSK